MLSTNVTYFISVPGPLTYQSLARLPKNYQERIEKEREMLAELHGNESHDVEPMRSVASDVDTDSSGIERGADDESSFNDSTVDVVPRSKARKGKRKKRTAPTDKKEWGCESDSSGDTEGPEEGFENEDGEVGVTIIS